MGKDKLMDKESVNRRLTPDSDRKSDLEKEDTLNVSGLSIGMTVKNYKVLCRLLGQETTTGKAKQYQLKNFERYFAWEKAGQKFTIVDIYDTPLEKIDLRKLGNNTGHYKTYNGTYNVDAKYNHAKGVYKIQLDNDVYIGSTIMGFRKRYIDHSENYQNMMDHTQRLLQNGGVFEILWIAPDNTSENDIRQKEQEYINQYKENEKLHIINKKPQVIIPVHKNKKTKFKKLFIDSRNYNFVIELLKNCEINFRE